MSLQGDGVQTDSTQYKQLIGSLLYITATRPDLMFTVCLLNRYMQSPTSYGIWYKRNGSELYNQVVQNPVLHGRSKHGFHVLRDLAKDGVVKLEYCGTHEQIAAVMKKALRLETFQIQFREGLWTY
ncbi:hypothetical protein V2J09_006436 [Rumex salicifolius]